SNSSRPTSPLFPSTTLFRSWSEVHTQVRNLDNGGRYEEAVDLAIETKEDRGATAAFTRLDDDLAKGITESRKVFLDDTTNASARSEEHTSELQSRENLVCRL